MIYFTRTTIYRKKKIGHSGAPDTINTRRYVSGLSKAECQAIQSGHTLLIKSLPASRGKQPTEYKRIEYRPKYKTNKYIPVDYFGRIPRKNPRYLPPDTRKENRTVIHKQRIYRTAPKQYEYTRRTECGQATPVNRRKNVRVRWDNVNCKICLKGRRTYYDENDNYINKGKP